MPAYLVQLPSRGGFTKFGRGGEAAVLVHAGDEDDAVAVAKGHYGGRAAAQWDEATVTEVVAGTDLADFDLRVAILDSTPAVDVVAEGGVLGAASGVVAAGGSGYSEDDVITLVGGTFTRAATFRVLTVSTDALLTVGLVDAGEYTAFPSNPVATTGGGTGGTLTVTSSSDGYVNLLAEAVGLLNATAPVAAAAVDVDGAVLTVAGAGDGLGDKQVIAELRFGGVAVPGLLGAVTDEGSAGSALEVALVASPALPAVYGGFPT